MITTRHQHQHQNLLCCYAHNQFHNILRLFGVLPNFPFITSKTMCDYHLYTWYIRVASQIAERLKT